MAELIEPRITWTTRKPAFNAARKGVGDVFVHHEGGPKRGVPANKGAVLHSIEESVIGRGYIAIDYNLMVFSDGDVWEGRGLAAEDAATIHNNPTSVSICAVGNFQDEAASDELVNGIGYAITVAAALGWTAAVPRVLPHQSVFATACPGRNLVARMNDIRKATTHPIDTRPPEVEEVFRIIRGDKQPQMWLTNWLEKRYVGSPAEVNAIIAAGVTQGQPPITWPQSWVDNIPVREAA